MADAFAIDRLAGWDEVRSKALVADYRISWLPIALKLIGLHPTWYIWSLDKIGPLLPRRHRL